MSSRCRSHTTTGGCSRCRLGSTGSSTRLHKLRHKLGVVLDIFLTDAHLVQLLKEILPFRINVLDVKALVGVPSDMAKMPKVRGKADLGFVQFAFRALLLLLAAKEATLSRLWSSARRSIGRRLGFLESLAVGDLLVEYACLLVIRERKGGQAVIDRKGVEEGALLVVLKVLVQLLFPNDASRTHKVHDAEEEG